MIKTYKEIVLYVVIVLHISPPVTQQSGGALSVMVIVVGNGSGDQSPNPGQGCLISILR